jgi:hypothetical protein
LRWSSSGRSSPTRGLAAIYYGPYDRTGGDSQLHIQFEGANGFPFADYDSLNNARDALSKTGTFEKGLYTWVDEQGRRHNKDGHEAGMEYAAGRKLEYPPPRYSSPMNIKPASFQWIQLEGGVLIKELGRFTERETRLAMLRLDGVTTFRLARPGQTTLLFVTSGAGLANGESIGERDGIMLQADDEGGTLSTTTEMELMLLGLPKSLPVAASASHRQLVPGGV